jgi:endonuclease/exonuclease/phosphatase family metal-dependent hydrolase
MRTGDDRTRLDGVRVVTQNLLGHHMDWPRRRAAVTSCFRRLDPDVLALQEVVVTDDHDQVAEILGDGYHVTHHPLREKDGSGISIASRWPIGAVRELDLRVGPRTADFSASAQIADIHWPHGDPPLLLVNHKPSYRTNLEYERGRQAVLTAGFVEEIVARTGQHVVLAGDFDAMPDAASVRFWRGEQALDGTSVAYRDAWQLTHRDEPGPTFAPSVVPLITEEWRHDLDRRIDYIFVRCVDGHGPSMSVTRCVRVLDVPVDDVWGSDHFGVTADIDESDVTA